MPDGLRTARTQLGGTVAPVPHITDRSVVGVDLPGERVETLRIITAQVAVSPIKNAAGFGAELGEFTLQGVEIRIHGCACLQFEEPQPALSQLAGNNKIVRPHTRHSGTGIGADTNETDFHQRALSAHHNTAVEAFTDATEPNGEAVGGPRAHQFEDIVTGGGRRHLERRVQPVALLDKFNRLAHRKSPGVMTHKQPDLAGALSNRPGERPKLERPYNGGRSRPTPQRPDQTASQCHEQYDPRQPSNRLCGKELRSRNHQAVRT